MRMKATGTTHPLDFSKVSPVDFERLVFAFLLRRWPWKSLDWYGQRGADGGRDILGIRETSRGKDECVVVACARYESLTKRKIVGDIDAIAKGQRKPDHLLIVAGGHVTAKQKDAAAAHAVTRGISKAEVWSSHELEEQLRHHAEPVLRRFYDGEVFPDDALALRAFVRWSIGDEAEAISLLARAFQRPAFTTPFHAESSLDDFRQAISDTIDAINTGIHRTRDGTIIGRYPSMHDFSDAVVRSSLQGISTALNRLRMEFDRRTRDGSIDPCSSGSHFHVAPDAARSMDRLRRQILDSVAALRPSVPPVEPPPNPPAT